MVKAKPILNKDGTTRTTRPLKITNHDMAPKDKGSAEYKKFLLQKIRDQTRRNKPMVLKMGHVTSGRLGFGKVKWQEKTSQWTAVWTDLGTPIKPYKPSLPMFYHSTPSLPMIPKPTILTATEKRAEKRKEAKKLKEKN